MDLPPEAVLVEQRARVEQILRVLSANGLLYDALNSGPDWLRAVRLPKPDVAVASMPFAARLSRSATELGPTFIKLGQILGTRPDLVGTEAADALASLQADVPPEPFPSIRSQVELTLGKTLEEAFASFDETPVGSASIGQVHSATLKDGREMVVKVVRPGIDDVINRDLAILGALAAIAEHRSAIARYHPVRILAEIGSALRAESDLNREAGFLRKFIGNFAAEPDVVFPQPIDELCGKHVLTMTRLPGNPISRTLTSMSDEDKHEFISRGVRVYLDMIFRDNLFHGDPHAGNLFWGDHKLGIIDFGEVGRLDDQLRDQFEALILAVVAQDSQWITDEILAIVTAPRDLDMRAFRHDLNDWIDKYVSVGASATDTSGAISGVLDILRRYNLSLPPDMAMLIKALLQLQGLLVSTGLSVKMFDYIAPYSKQILLQQLSPKRLAGRARTTARGWGRLMSDTPADVQEILSAVRRGELRVPMDINGLDKPVNRLVAGILLASLVRGSSQLWANKAQPTIAGVSVPGAAGTIASAAAALGMLRILLKSGGFISRDQL